MEIPAAAVFEYAWIVLIGAIGLVWRLLMALSKRVRSLEQGHAVQTQRQDAMEKNFDQRWDSLMEHIREIKEILRDTKK